MSTPFRQASHAWLTTPHTSIAELQAMELDSYDTIIVAFSGGKDSVACVLHLLDLGVPKHKIELWHHLVDGREGSMLMDWACTEAYCRAFAEALGLKIYFSWKEGGFEREMHRNDTPTAQTWFEIPNLNGGVTLNRTGGKGPNGNRHNLFPQVSPDLSVRWCSAYLKIDVCAAAIRNQSRFNHKRTLVVTGERAEESAARAKYNTLEPHRADRRSGKLRRHVDQWRPVHAWSREQVWDIIERYRVNPHPGYRLGWGRLSCAACIFGNESQWASLRVVNPKQFARIVELEKASGKTIKRKLSVIETAAKGKPYKMRDEDIKAALADTWGEPIIVTDWKLPAGAYGDSNGPT